MIQTKFNPKSYLSYYIIYFYFLPWRSALKPRSINILKAYENIYNVYNAVAHL